MFITRSNYENILSRLRELESVVTEQKYLLMSVARETGLEYHCKRTTDAYYAKPEKGNPEK